MLTLLGLEIQQRPTPIPTRTRQRDDRFLKDSDTNIKIKVIYDEAKEETINLYDVDEDHYGVLADMITDLLEVK